MPYALKWVFFHCITDSALSTAASSWKESWCNGEMGRGEIYLKAVCFLPGGAWLGVGPGELSS